MNQNEHIVVTFHIRGDNFDVEEVTRKLQITPHVVARKGFAPEHDQEAPPSKTHFWSIKANPKDFDTISMEILAMSLVNQVLPNADFVRELSIDNQVQIVCSIYSDKLKNWLTLSPELMSNLSSLGATFDVTIYADSI